jgi:hypothetical protein
MASKVLFLFHDDRLSSSSVGVGDSHDHRRRQLDILTDTLSIRKIVHLNLTHYETFEALKGDSGTSSLLGTLPHDLLDGSPTTSTTIGSSSPHIFYLAVFSQDYRLVHHAIDILLSFLCERLCDAEHPVRVVLVEDLVFVARPYILDNKEKNFFKNIRRHCEERFHCGFHDFAFSTESSHALMNRWGEGDTHVVRIPELADAASDYWQRIVNGIAFEEMRNQGNAVPRLISIQSIENAVGLPLYRHPNDEEPVNIVMQPVVQELRALVEKHTGIVGLNHVLIQHYRDGRDNIAQHSDKTLDIDRFTPILNLSTGSTRTLVIHHKQNRARIEHIPLRHGECVVFGLRTNQLWYHEVPKDVTMPVDALFGTSRVSFTFRKIATFVTPDGVLIGQGSPFKTTQDFANRKGEYLTLGTEERSELICAFSKENKQGDEFDWNEAYGRGFLFK